MKHSSDKLCLVGADPLSSLAWNSLLELKHATRWLCWQSEANCLSLQFGEIQGDFGKLQGQRRRMPAEGPRISMGWIGLSLTQGAARPSFHSREGRFRNTAPVPRRHSRSSIQCPLPGSFRTSTHGLLMSASDPKRTLRPAYLCCAAARIRRGGECIGASNASDRPDQFAWRRFAISPGVSAEARNPKRPVR